MPKKTTRKKTTKKTKKAAKIKQEEEPKEESKKEQDEKSDEKQENKELSEEEKQKQEEEKKKQEEEKKKQEEEEKQKQEEEKKRKESFQKAGDIFKQVVEFIKPEIKIGAKYLDICEKIENKIIELGGQIGFPPNICVNEVAAHYSPQPDDPKVINDGDVVKIDLGVAVEGYVVDGAFTISFNKEERTKNLITAVETAVLKGLSMIKPGVKTNEIAKVTYDIIKNFGYNVIKDLHGHMIERWMIHGGKEIPNFPTPSGEPFEEGEVYALECFASTGAGNIHRSSICTIYSLDPTSERIAIRGKITRKVLGWIGANKKTLPFSIREILKEFRGGRFAMRELTNNDKLIEHFVLKEKEGQYVAQSEHTFMVTADGIERLT